MGTSLYVRLLLYTRSNLDCGREINHHNLSSQPLFDLSRPTAFVIHGYRPTGAPPIWINHLVNLMAEQEDMNVIVVDWNRGAANLNYFTAVIYTREAAHNLTGFIMNMEEEGASLSSVHLIGVSLGAHLAGFVGANLDLMTGLLQVMMSASGGRHFCNWDKPKSSSAPQPHCPTGVSPHWNQYLRWGTIYIKLYSGRNFTEARIDHKLFRLEQYTSTRLLAQFDEDLQNIQKISLRINTGNIIGLRYKIRLLRIRFTPLEHPDRPLMCRHDIIMEENREVVFRPLPCDSHL